MPELLSDNSLSRRAPKHLMHQRAPASAKKKGTTPPSVQGVGLLVKAFQLLDLFTRDQPDWTRPELLTATGLSRSTLSRLVRFLHGRGMLSYSDRTGRYALGVAAIDLGRRAARESSLMKLCAETLKQLADQTGETVMLTAYDARQAKVICLEQIPSVKEGLRVFERIGAAFPLYRGASSKAVLAFLPESEMVSVLTLMQREDPGSDALRLRDELKAVRESGLATSIEETYPGVAGLAVPVLAGDGIPLGSIAVAAPIIRMGPGARTRIGKILKAAGLRLSKSLGDEA